MFIPGHVGITFFLAYMFSLSPIYAAIGVLLPDLIDKPLNIFGLAPAARYIGHTLLALVLSFVFSYILTRNTKITLAIVFGYFLHLLEDLPFFVPWFYPFIDYAFPIGPFSFRYSVFTAIFDVIGTLLLVYILAKDKKLLVSYLDSSVNLLKKFHLYKER